MHNLYKKSSPTLLKMMKHLSGQGIEVIIIFIQRSTINIRRKNVLPLRVTESWKSLLETVVQAKFI